MSITAAEANAQLANINSVDALRGLINQLDITDTGGVTMLYSGGNSGTIVDTRSSREKISAQLVRHRLPDF